MSAIIDCTPVHLLYVATRLPRRDVEEALALGYPDVQAVAVQRAAERGVKWTVVDATGTPKACFGITDSPVPGVGVMWLLRTVDAGPFVRAGFRAVKAIFATREYRRIEASARSDCMPCRKFLEWLGFEYEGTKREFFTDGCAVEMYAYVRQP